MPSVTTSTFGRAERRVVVVGEQDPLAADRVVRRQPSRAARGRGPGARRCQRAEPLVSSARGDGAASAKPSTSSSRAAVDRRRASARCSAGNAAVERALEPGQRPVAARHDPRRRALEDVQLLDLRLDLRARTGSPTRRCRSPRRARRSRSWSWSQRAPSGRSCPRSASRPGMSGSLRLAAAAPAPATSTRAVSGPLEVSSAPALRVVVPVAPLDLACRSACARRSADVARRRARR